jgi:hypothetical protein
VFKYHACKPASLTGSVYVLKAKEGSLGYSGAAVLDLTCKPDDAEKVVSVVQATITFSLSPPTVDSVAGKRASTASSGARYPPRSPPRSFSENTLVARRSPGRSWRSAPALLRPLPSTRTMCSGCGVSITEDGRTRAARRTKSTMNMPTEVVGLGEQELCGDAVVPREPVHLPLHGPARQDGRSGLSSPSRREGYCRPPSTKMT